MEYAKTIDRYFDKFPQWNESLNLLRSIFLETRLEETVKWGMPVYCIDGKNIAGIGAFKAYVGIWFYQGAFLKDPHNLLINAQDGKTKAMRQIRFNSFEEINSEIIRQYILEAIENQKRGLEIKPDTNKPLAIPKELKEALNGDGKLKESFDKFTLSKQREFAEYINEAKRDETKMKRLEKIIPYIYEGKGLNDQYK